MNFRVLAVKGGMKSPNWVAIDYVIRALTVHTFPLPDDQNQRKKEKKNQITLYGTNIAPLFFFFSAL